MTNESVRVGICVPTARPTTITEFLSQWSAEWTRYAPSILVSVFVHQDHQSQTSRPVDSHGLDVVCTSHQDIEATLGPKHWIIPRQSGSCRSFPVYLAWRAGCDYIITLDDDCYPESSSEGGFIEGHLKAFRRDRWFRPIHGDEARGIPYRRLGQLAVRINQGLWSGVPDLDAPTSLVRLREPRDHIVRREYDVVPTGMAFPLSAMNVCYHRSVVVAAYNLLMGPAAAGLDRFDDVWSGLILKRILDYMGWYVTVGLPIVRHERKSDPFANLRKEALGMSIHELLWDYILDCRLDPDLTLTEAYRSMAERIASFPEHYGECGASLEYFRTLACAMITWSELFVSD